MWVHSFEYLKGCCAFYVFFVYALYVIVKSILRTLSQWLSGLETEILEMWVHSFESLKGYRAFYVFLYMLYVIVKIF